MTTTDEKKETGSGHSHLPPVPPAPEPKKLDKAAIQAAFTKALDRVTKNLGPTPNEGEITALEDLAETFDEILNHAIWSSTAPYDFSIPTGPISSTGEPILQPTPPTGGPPEDSGLTPAQARARRQRELSVSKPPDYAAEVELDRKLHPDKWKKIDDENKRLEDRQAHASQLPAGPNPSFQGPRTSKEVKQA